MNTARALGALQALLLWELGCLSRTTAVIGFYRAHQECRGWSDPLLILISIQHTVAAQSRIVPLLVENVSARLGTG